MCDKRPPLVVVVDVAPAFTPHIETKTNTITQITRVEQVEKHISTTTPYVQWYRLVINTAKRGLKWVYYDLYL